MYPIFKDDFGICRVSARPANSKTKGECQMIKLIKKYKHIVNMVCIFLAVIIVFTLVRVFAMPELALKSRSEELNPYSQALTKPLVSGDIIEQTFTSEKALRSVILYADMSEANGDVSIKAQLKDDSDTAVAQSGGVIVYTEDMLTPHVIVAFEDAIDMSLYEELTLSVEVELQSEGTVSFLKSEEKVPQMDDITVNGKQQSGSLTTTLGVDAIGNFIIVYYNVIMVLCALFLCALYLMAFVLKVSLHNMFLVMALSVGLIYMMLLPPYGATDEKQHINQSFNNAARTMGMWWGYEFTTTETIKRPSDSNPVLEEELTSVYSYEELAGGILQLSPDGPYDSQIFATEEVGGYQLPYFLTSAVVMAGKFLRLGYVQVLVLGRLANYLFFVLLAYLSVKIVPFGKMIFAAVALLPGTIHVAASFSRDSFTIAMAMLFVALCLRATSKKTNVPWWELAVLLAVGFLFVPAKIVYAPIIIIVLAIKVKNFANKKVMALIKIGVVALALVFSVATGFVIIQQSLFSAGTDQHYQDTVILATQPQQAIDTFSAAYIDDLTYTLRFMVNYPGKVATLLVNTAVHNSQSLGQTLVGGTLGNNNLQLSWLVVIAYYVILVLSTQCGHNPCVLREKKNMLIYWAAFLACSALVVGACVLWTPVNHLFIYGMQGRYFVPILPLFLLLIKPKRDVIYASMAGKLLFVIGIAQVITSLNIFYEVSLR